MKLDIRPARLADVATLLELYRALDVGDEPAPELAAAQRHFEQLTANPGHRIYVAEDDGRIVGTFALVFVGGLPHSARPSCIVEDVVVAAARRGRGVGRTMMQFAMQACAQERCYKLVLSSHVKRAEAHRFYEGLGFERHGYSFLIQDGAA